MTLEQILTDITAALGAIGLLCSLIAHLPISPKWAERFARFATYAANTKFSVNVRETLPKKDDEPKLPPMFPGSGLVLLLAIGFAFHVNACASAPPKPPCDPTTLATLTAECSAQAFECGLQGIPKAECAAIADCHARLDARREACR
jgi:hypothetical protein